MRRGAWLAGVGAMVLVAACGLSQPKKDPPEFSAEHIDLSRQDSILDTLDPEEREAFLRSGMSGARPEHEVTPGEDSEKSADEAAKVTISLLSVALSVAAVAAPFFLF